MLFQKLVFTSKGVCKPSMEKRTLLIVCSWYNCHLQLSQHFVLAYEVQNTKDRFFERSLVTPTISLLSELSLSEFQK